MDKSYAIKIWRKNHFTLRLYDLGYSRKNINELGYQFKDGNKIIFEGRDFYCSPLYPYDSLETVYALLDFLSLQPGEDASENFEYYTELQMSWARSRRRDELKEIVNLWHSRQENH